MSARRGAPRTMGRMISIGAWAMCALLVAQGVVAHPAPVVPGTAVDVGVNLPALDGSFQYFDWDGAGFGVFRNLFAHCADTWKEWATYDNGETWRRWYNALDYDDVTGYPLAISQDPSFYVAASCSIGGRSVFGGWMVQNGTYNVTWSGTGNVSLATPLNPLTTRVQHAAASGNEAVFQHQSAEGSMEVMITNSSAADPVRDVRVIACDDVDQSAESGAGASFTPEFLNLVSEFDALRVTGWVRPGTSARTWAERATPATYSQHTSRGVALEYIVELANATNISAVWISMPPHEGDTDAWSNDDTDYTEIAFNGTYTYETAAFLFRSLQPHVRVYVEYLGGEVSRFSGLSQGLLEGSMKVWTAFERALNDTQLANDSTDIPPIPRRRLVRAVTVWSVDGYAHVLNQLKELAGRIDAVGIHGSIGFSMNGEADGMSSSGEWDTRFANQTREELLDALQRSVYSAEYEYNRFVQSVNATSKNGRGGVEIVASYGGVQMHAATYGYRHALYTLDACNVSDSYPCSHANTRLYFGNKTAYMEKRPQVVANAEAEAWVDARLVTLSRDPAIKDMLLDHLWRWQAIGGGTYFSEPLVKRPVDCPIGGKGCGAGGMFHVPGPQSFECRDGNECPTLWAYREYIAGNGSAVLPFAARPANGSAIWGLNGSAEGAADCKWGLAALPRNSAHRAQADDVCDMCFAGVTGANCSNFTNITPARCNPDLGINLAGIADWSSAWNFVDVFKASRAWIPQEFTSYTWDTEESIDLNDEGYPARLHANQRVGTMMIRDLESHIPSGTYTILYEGDGVLWCSMSDVKAVRRWIGRLECDVEASSDGNNGLFLTLEYVNPAMPVRNIRVLMPGFSDARARVVPFHPMWLERLQPFRALRFMNWGNANSNPAANWSQVNDIRTRRTFAGEFGVPVSEMIRVANMLGTDTWFCLPMAASDDYVREHAILVRDTLRPDVKVWLEYANEVWHTGFASGVYAQQQGLLQGLGHGNAHDARFCFAAYRTRRIREIFAEVFASDVHRRQVGEHILTVLATQFSNPDVTDRMLGCNSTEVVVDALGVGPYIGGAVDLDTILDILDADDDGDDANNDDSAAGGGNGDAGDDDTDDGVVAGADDGDDEEAADLSRALDYIFEVTLPNAMAAVNATLPEHWALARHYNVTRMVAYEAGQHLTGDGTSTDVAMLANRDERMAAVYKAYLRLLQSHNVELIMHFGSIGQQSQYGSWGALTDTDQRTTDAPKYMALLDHIEEQALANGTQCANPAKYAIYDEDRSLAYADVIATQNCSGNGLHDRFGECQCFFAYSGDRCEILEPENVYDCGYKCTFYQGVCEPVRQEDTYVYHECRCHEPYYGRHCSLFDCRKNCSYHGRCIDADVCSCYAGFRGQYCEDDCGCNGHGECLPPPVDVDGRNDTDWPTCRCDYGYHWASAARGCVRTEPEVSAIAAATATSHACNVSDPTSCVYGDCMPSGSCECWRGYAGADCSQRTARTVDSPLGLNIGGPSYWSTEWVWLDAMKTSSAWVSLNARDWFAENPWGNGMEVHLRHDGYPARLLPGQVLAKLLKRDVKYHTPSGHYVCLYDGEGDIDFGFDATVLSYSHKRIDLDFAPTANVECTAAYCGDNGIFLTLTRTNPENPIHNIRVVPATFLETFEQFPFHPFFVKSLEPYRALRFMDWQRTNDEAPEQASTSDDGNNDTNASVDATRVLPQFASQAHGFNDASVSRALRGVAWEYMVHLSNIVGAAPWFCVHHLATDAEMAAFAQYVKEHLRPDVQVFVERSNEVWNPLFPANAHSRTMGMQRGYNSTPDAVWEAGRRYHAQRSIEIFQIWRDVFGESDLDPVHGGGRVQTILSTQTGSTSVTATLLEWPGVRNHTSALGVAGYYTCGNLGSSENAPTTALMTSQEVVAACQELLDLNGGRNATQYVRDRRAQAAAYGLPVAVYEEGIGLVEQATIEYGYETEGLAAVLIGANRHPDMEFVYRDYLLALDDATTNIVPESTNDHPIMHFSSTGLFGRYGSWGLVEFTGQPLPEAPKLRALLSFVRNASATSVVRDPDQECIRAHSHFAGMDAGYGSYWGNPVISKPRAGDVWVSGKVAVVEWDPTGAPSRAEGNATEYATEVDVILWYNGSNCRISPGPGARNLSGAVSHVLARGVPRQRGRLAVRVPDTFTYEEAVMYNRDGGQFMVEVTDGVTRNVSERFQLLPPFMLVKEDGPCCSGTASDTVACQVRRPGSTHPLVHRSATTASGTQYAFCPVKEDMFSNSKQRHSEQVAEHWGNFSVQSCELDTSTGCRKYRTARDGSSVSRFKPVRDCVAQHSPRPNTIFRAPAAPPDTLLSQCVAWAGDADQFDAGVEALGLGTHSCDAAEDDSRSGGGSGGVNVCANRLSGVVNPVLQDCSVCVLSIQIAGRNHTECDDAFRTASTSHAGLFVLPRFNAAARSVRSVGILLDQQGTTTDSRCVDAATGIALTVSLYAPPGATVISPLTTLVLSVSDVQGISIEAAETVVTDALGLDLGSNSSLLHFDAHGSTGDVDESGIGDAVVSASTYVMNILMQASTMVDAVDSSLPSSGGRVRRLANETSLGDDDGSAATTSTVLESFLASIAETLVEYSQQNVTMDLLDSGTVSEVLSDVLNSVDASLPDAVIEAIADATTTINELMAQTGGSGVNVTGPNNSSDSVGSGANVSSASLQVVAQSFLTESVRTLVQLVLEEEGNSTAALAAFLNDTQTGSILSAAMDAELPEEGCTDATALNYDAEADVDNGLCTYATENDDGMVGGGDDDNVIGSSSDALGGLLLLGIGGVALVLVVVVGIALAVRSRRTSSTSRSSSGGSQKSACSLVQVHVRDEEMQERDAEAELAPRNLPAASVAPASVAAARL